MSQKRSRVKDEEIDHVASAYLSAPAPPPPGASADESSLLDEGDLSFSEAPTDPMPIVGQNFAMDEASMSDGEGRAAPKERKKKKKKKKKKKETTFWAHPIGLTLNPLHANVLIVFEREVPLHIAPAFGQQRYFFMPLESRSAGLWNVLCEYRFKRAYLGPCNLTISFTRAFGERRIPTPLKPLPVHGLHPYDMAIMNDIEVLGERVFATDPQRKLQLTMGGGSRALSVAIVKRALGSSLAPLARAYPQWTDAVPDTPLFQALGLHGQRLVTLDRLLEVLAILHGHRLVNRLAALHRRHVDSQRTTIYPKPAKPLKAKDKAFLRALELALPRESKSSGFERSRPSTLLKKWTGPTIQKALRAAGRQQNAGRQLLRAFNFLDYGKEDLAFVAIPQDEAHQLLHSVPVPLCPPRYRERFLLGGVSCRLGQLSGGDADKIAVLSNEELVLLQMLLDGNATEAWLRKTPWKALWFALHRAGGFRALVPTDPDHDTYVALLDRLLAKALMDSAGRYASYTPRIAYHLSWRQLLYQIATLVDAAATTVDLQTESLQTPLWYGGPSLQAYALGFTARVLQHEFAGRLPADASSAAQLLGFVPLGATGRYFMVRRLAPFETYRAHLAESTTGFHPDLSLPALQIPLKPTEFLQQAMALRALRTLAEVHADRITMVAHALEARTALRSMRARVREALFGQAWSVCVVHPTGAHAPFTHSAYEKAFAPEAFATGAAVGDDDLDDLGLEASSDDEEEEDAGDTHRQRLSFALGALSSIPADQRKEVYVVNLEAFSGPELKRLACWLATNPAIERIVLHYRSGAYFQAAGDPVGLARQVLDVASFGDLTSHLGPHASSALVQERWTRELATRFDKSVARGRAQLLGVSEGKLIALPRTTKELRLAAVQEPWLNGLRPRRPHDEREAPVYWTTWAVLQQLSAAAWGMLYASELRLVVRDVPAAITPAAFPEALDTLYRESDAGTHVPHLNQHPLVCARVFLLDDAVDGADLSRCFKA